MTLAEMVEKYGEIRITKVYSVKHDNKGIALIIRQIVDNQVVEHNVAEVHYRVALRDADPVSGASVDEALTNVK
jgi:hypothetical protein